MRSLHVALFLVISFGAVVLRVTSTDDEYYRNHFYVCKDSIIVVQDISILCDSPGAYYYGSGKYRNSAQCQAGDKAKLQIVFDISQYYFGYTDAYLTVQVQASGSVPTEYLYSSESFCSTAKATNGEACPNFGTYKISQNFYFGSSNDDDLYDFTPRVIIGISSRASSNQFDLGGANTKQCNAGYFSDWTAGVRKSAANTVANFLATFGILTFGLSAVALVAWFVVRQARKQQTKIIIVDEDLDDQSGGYYIQDELNDDDDEVL